MDNDYVWDDTLVSERMASEVRITERVGSTGEWGTCSIGETEWSEG